MARELQELRSRSIAVAQVEDVLCNLPPNTGRSVLLLYLNNTTFLNDNGRMEDLVLKSLKIGIQIILAHEKDSTKGGCDFDTILNQTPDELTNPPHNLYNAMAVPLYTFDSYRQVSLRLLIDKMLKSIVFSKSES